MIQANVHCIKDYQPSRRGARGNGEPASDRGPALASAFMGMEGTLNDLARMSQISVDMAGDVLNNRGAIDEQQQELLLFTIYHLHEMIIGVRDRFYSDHEKAGSV